jgi:endonuclease YncB( thermonuclease family)
LLGPPGQRQLAGCRAAHRVVLGRSPAGAGVAPCVLALLALRSASRDCTRQPAGCRAAHRVIAALLVAAALAGCSGSLEDLAAVSGEERSARVTRHTDGDTFWLSGIGKVRLIGVDTPEVYGGVECFGRQASAFLERVLPLGSRVTYRLGVEPRDRYGRALAYVYTEDGRLLNLMLVRRGYAQPLTVPPNVELAGRFAAAARRARAAARGLWAPGACR